MWGLLWEPVCAVTRTCGTPALFLLVKAKEKWDCLGGFQVKRKAWARGSKNAEAYLLFPICTFSSIFIHANLTGIQAPGELPKPAQCSNLAPLLLWGHACQRSIDMHIERGCVPPYSRLSKGSGVPLKKQWTDRAAGDFARCCTC